MTTIRLGSNKGRDPGKAKSGTLRPFYDLLRGKSFSVQNSQAHSLEAVCQSLGWAVASPIRTAMWRKQAANTGSQGSGWPKSPYGDWHRSTPA